jgi:hypothetical protein
VYICINQKVKRQNDFRCGQRPARYYAEGFSRIIVRPPEVQSVGSACRWVVVALAAVFYAASLLLPTATPFNPDFSDTTYPGYVAFGAWKVVLDWAPSKIDWWLLGGAWFANPAIWLAIIFVAANYWRVAAAAACCGLLLGLVVLPRYHPIVAGLPGYWAWLSSAGILLAASVYSVGRSRRTSG